MNSNNYFKFINDSKLIISENSRDKLENTNCLSAIVESSLSQDEKERLKSLLSRSLENLDYNLTKFEKKYCSTGLKIYWAEDYKDIFKELRSLISFNKIKTAYYSSSYIYEEIGLADFLKKEKVKYTDNDAILQFVDVYKLISNTGNMLIMDKNYTKYKQVNSGKINIFIVGIEQIIESLSDADLYIKENVALSGKDYDSGFFYRPSRTGRDYLFIVDNGRTNLLSFEKQRLVLTCLHCGLCKKVCPVYELVGNKPFNNVFSGPIASVSLPFLENLKSYKHVSYACTLCGNCQKKCPIDIPIKDLILENRKYFRVTGNVDKSDNKRYSKYKNIVQSRDKMNKSRFFRKKRLKKFLSKSLRNSVLLPKLEKKSFNVQYVKKRK
jgi:L-lactate utilization protein LutB